MPNSFTILDVRDRIQQAQSVTVLTGAGISADSGVPTFRGADGLWKNFRPEELASPDAFAQDPKLVAVEVNTQMVDQENLGTTSLQEDDKLEFLFFMGGGA